MTKRLAPAPSNFWKTFVFSSCPTEQHKATIMARRDRGGSSAMRVSLGALVFVMVILYGAGVASAKPSYKETFTHDGAVSAVSHRDIEEIPLTLSPTSPKQQHTPPRLTRTPCWVGWVGVFVSCFPRQRASETVASPCCWTNAHTAIACFCFLFNKSNIPVQLSLIVSAVPTGVAAPRRSRLGQAVFLRHGDAQVLVERSQRRSGARQGGERRRRSRSRSRGRGRGEKGGPS